MRPDCRASFSIYDVFQRTAHLADAWRRRERICRSAPFTIQITPPTYERTILPATYDGIVFIAQSTAAKPLE
jgi:erythromycin esterase-like protein